VSCSSIFSISSPGAFIIRVLIAECLPVLCFPHGGAHL
jgi:hypothetical protein